MGVIQLGNYDWSVKSATLGCKILPVDQADFHWGPGTGGISWHFDINAEDREIDGEWMAPYLYSQVLKLKVASWKGFEGQKVTWLPPDAYEDRGWPSICIFEHEDILDPEIRFSVRNGSEFAFSLSGRYAFFEREPDDLQVNTAIQFVGVNVSAPDPETAWQRLCQHFDGNDFSQEPIRPYEKWGVPLSYIGFEPLVT